MLPAKFLLFRAMLLVRFMNMAGNFSFTHYRSYFFFTVVFYVSRWVNLVVHSMFIYGDEELYLQAIPEYHNPL